MESFACIEHPVSRREACGADAIGELDRSTFGMKRSGCGRATGRVTLRIQAEALKRNDGFNDEVA